MDRCCFTPVGSFFDGLLVAVRHASLHFLGPGRVLAASFGGAVTREMWYSVSAVTCGGSGTSIDRGLKEGFRLIDRKARDEAEA